MFQFWVVMVVIFFQLIAAQKARDDFEESEKALREVEDQIKLVDLYHKWDLFSHVNLFYCV